MSSMQKVVIVEEILETSKFRYFDRRRDPEGEHATLFWVIPCGKFYGACRGLGSPISRRWRTQEEAIKEIARNFFDHPLGIEIDFEIINQ